jgi:hypothetical protein
MRYAISATVNFEDGELDTPVSSCMMGDTLIWIYRLLKREPKATSFTVIIIPDKEPHENVI